MVLIAQNCEKHEKLRNCRTGNNKSEFDECRVIFAELMAGNLVCRVQKVYELQMNVRVNGRGGRVHITEVVDDVKQVVTCFHLFSACYASNDSTPLNIMYIPARWPPKNIPNICMHYAAK